MAHSARTDPGVLAFRAGVLRERLLDIGEVAQWLKRHRTTAAGARLVKLASELASYYWWDERDALKFVLTDETPPRSPVRAHKEITFPSAGGPRVRLEVEAWLPPDTVRSVYARFHDRLTQGKGGRRTRTRSLTPRAVALVAFVDSTPGSWAQRLVLWNKNHPAWRYSDDRRNFRRAYQAAARQLDVFPTFLSF